MNDLVGKAISLIAVHIAGLVVFWILWNYIITPMYDMPDLDITESVSLYLIIDVLFFIVEGVSGGSK